MPALGVMDQIQQAINELIKHGTILQKHHGTLKTRLAVAFRDSRPPPSDGKQYSRTEISKNTKENRAKKIYMDILEHDPALFLPLLLGAAPGTCPRVNVEGLKGFTSQGKIRLKDGAKDILTTLAEEKGIDTTEHFQTLLRALFPDGFSSDEEADTSQAPDLAAPTTTVEGLKGDYYAYYAAHMEAITHLLTDVTSAAVSRRHAREPQVDPTMTECVRMRLPLERHEDAIIFLDVEGAVELAKTIFPQTQHVVFPAPLTKPLESHGRRENHTIPPSPGLIDIDDHGYFTLAGGHCVGFPKVFRHTLCNAVNGSQLRSWEQEHFLLETTDCVVMTISRRNPQYGTLRIRIGFWEAFDIVQKLYGPMS